MMHSAMAYKPVILLATVASLLNGALAVSQFESDAAFSIVATDMNVTGPGSLSGFNSPPPALLRGENGLDTSNGRFNIVDDGYYVFLIHGDGVTVGMGPPELRVAGANGTNWTIANVIDKVHVVAELKRGDTVQIFLPTGTRVIGNTQNPFIYNAFLLYHTPISSFPRVRQSAFTVFVNKLGLPVANDALTDYNNSIVDIGPDFSLQDGVFLVPMKGMYVFHLSATFTAPPPATPAIALTVNDAEKSRVSAQHGMTPTPRSNAAITVSFSLRQNDRVQLKNVFATPTAQLEAFLSGYLLS